MTWVRTLLAAVVITSLLAGGPVPADARPVVASDARVGGVPTWTETRAPVVLRANTVVSEVACSPTGTSCVAVGHRFDEDGEQVIAIQRWDGSTWQAETPPAGASAGLVNVACSTATDCVALEDTQPPRGPTRRLAVRSAAGWRWVEFTSPRHAADFRFVSCASGTSCLVASHGGDFVTVDGTTVRVLPRMPLRPSDISCPTATYCAAVETTSVFEWDGATWTETPLGTEYMWDVGCWAERACLALGGGYAGTPTYARSPEMTWHPVPSPSGRPVDESSLSARLSLGLECVPNDKCHLLRLTGRRRAPDLQLLTWTTEGWFSNSVPTADGMIQALGCRPGECVVMDAIVDLNEYPLRARALHSYGPAWAHRSMVNPRGVLPGSRPFEASCPARDWCLAIGDSGDGEEQYVVRRTGRRWIELPAKLESQWDVDCWQPGSCVVAGWQDKKPQIAVLDAGRWQRQRALSPPWLVKGSMTGVSCVGPQCTYTGYYQARHDAGYGTFVARRDGAGWHAQRLGPLVEYDTWFHAFPSIDCPTVSRCVVVTSQYEPRKPRQEGGQVENSYEAALEDGTWRWRKIGHAFSLFDLDCADADHCVAGGSDEYPGLIMARGPDGRWHRVAAPTRNADFWSVSCPTSRECYVAGTGSRVRRLVRTPTGWRARATGPRDMTRITCWAPRSCLTFDNRTAHVSR